MKIITFRDRYPYPKSVAVGLPTDKNVESVRFGVPHLHPQQRAYIYMQLPDDDGKTRHDVVELMDDELTVTDYIAAKAGMIQCYAEITDPDGAIMWHSDVFALEVRPLNDLTGEIEKDFPTALQQAMTATAADRDAAASAAQNASSEADRAHTEAESAASSAANADLSAINANGDAYQARKSAQSASSSAISASMHAKTAETAAGNASRYANAANKSSAQATSAKTAAETARDEAVSAADKAASTTAETIRTQMQGYADAAADSAEAAATVAGEAAGSASAAAGSAGSAAESASAAAQSLIDVQTAAQQGLQQIQQKIDDFEPDLYVKAQRIGQHNFFDDRYQRQALYFTAANKTFQVSDKTDVRLVIVDCEPGTRYTIKRPDATSQWRAGSCPDFPALGGAITNTVEGQRDTLNILTITAGENDRYIAVQLWLDALAPALRDIETAVANLVVESDITPPALQNSVNTNARSIAAINRIIENQQKIVIITQEQYNLLPPDESNTIYLVGTNPVTIQIGK